MEKEQLGEPISSRNGVPQGRKTSANLFSFYISDMGESIKVEKSFLHPVCILQLADDTAIIADSKETLSNIFNQLIKYSENKLMSGNLTKTFYIHLKEAGIDDAIKINNKDKIYSAKNGKHIYLGVLFVNSQDSQEHIVANIENRKFNIKK